METEPGLRGQDTDLQFLPLKNLSVGVEGKRGRGLNVPVAVAWVPEALSVQLLA